MFTLWVYFFGKFLSLSMEALFQMIIRDREFIFDFDVYRILNFNSRRRGCIIDPSYEVFQNK